MHGIQNLNVSIQRKLNLIGIKDSHLTKDSAQV